MGELSEMTEKLCKKRNLKGSIFNSWLIDKLVCIFHWVTMGGYWGSFCKYNHVIYEGNVTMNWVLKTCPLNIQVWCKWRIHSTMAWEGLREKMTALSKCLESTEGQNPASEARGKSFLGMRVILRGSHSCVSLDLCLKRTHQKLVPDLYKMFMVHDEIRKLRKI